MLPFSLNIHGKLYVYDRPAVMGIINVTPDSFYTESRVVDYNQTAMRAQSMIEQGADMIDVGAYSSRHGCSDVSESEEIDRLAPALEAIRSIDADIPVSVDTFRSRVAKIAIEQYGASIINDISAGDLDPEMLITISQLRVPYIMMHMRGTPQTMDQQCKYADVAAEVLEHLARKVSQANLLGINDVIVDPGFGFSKTIEQNYALLRQLNALQALHCPMLVGLSRKSMAWRPLGITPADSLPATVALNTYALMQGASILRVHDVAAAKQAVDITQMLLN